MGSWVCYGLGADDGRPARLRRAHLAGPRRADAADRGAAVAQRVPAEPVPGRPVPLAGATRCSTSRPRRACSRDQQRDVVDAVAALNRRAARTGSTTPRSHARIAQYEMAFRMQTSVPELMDLVQRADSGLRAVRRRRRATARFAANCLLARRLAERGVRFIQLYHRDWDHHGRIKGDIAMQGPRGRPARPRRSSRTSSSAGCSTTRWSSGAASSAARRWRRATAATTTSRASRCGWPAAASRGGITYGATDELGYHAVENVVSRPRPARDDAAPPRHRPHAADLSASRAATSA